MTLERACHLSCTNKAVAQCFVPGWSMTFRSRCTPFGQSRRNEAKEFATPSDALSLGTPVPEVLKLKLPRGPPASCVCSSTSMLFRHSPPTLTVCVFNSLVSVVATFQVFSERSQGWLAENPSTGPE